VSVIYKCCEPLPAHSFSALSLVELATIFYCLRFETSLFVASYYSQGDGGGIRPRLHTGEVDVEVEVTLRLSVYRQSICLGVEPLETHDQNLFFPNCILAILVLT
jgi:hypothetical protein